MFVLDNEAANGSGKLLKPLERLAVNVEMVGIGNMLYVGQSDGDVLQEERLLVLGGTEVLVLKRFECKCSHQPGIIFAEIVKILFMLELFLALRKDWVGDQFDVGIATMRPKDFSLLLQSHLRPICFPERFRLQITVLTSHS
jgi:hypothetical protein